MGYIGAEGRGQNMGGISGPDYLTCHGECDMEWAKEGQ